ncbi:MAG: PhzF family phenazine biosynthesis protein [Marinosulfonomonas sp.]|nr:PhzF family phenazine biosynthesis protein [Marinosulfonomonas sp.]
MSYTFDWVDAFTDKVFGGNGCVVVHDADALSLDDRMALVRETSLSECAYVVASDKADFGARYYLAGQEILMAGHPTVATVVSLVKRGLIDMSGGRAEITLEVGSGVLPIEITQDQQGRVNVTMTQQKPEFGAKHDPADIAAIYGLSADDIVGTPQTVSTGSGFAITVLRSKEALRAAQLNAAALKDYFADTRDVFTEAFLVTLGGETGLGDTFSRLLLPPPMPAEDPFTGSATGCMAAYLWAHGLIDTPVFAAEQGHWMGRPGRSQVEVLGPRSDISGVKVSGTGVVVMQGDLLL